MESKEQRNQELILDILLCFDFKKVQKVMELVEWKWFSAQTDSGVPSVRDLQRRAKRLLEDLVSGKYGSEDDSACISTGGFTAHWGFHWDERRPALRFTLEEHEGLLEKDYEND